MPEVSTDAVESLLSDLDFPASKEDVVRAAEHRARHVDDDAVKALRALPLGEYASRAEVLRSIASVDATGQGRSQKPAQARDKAHANVAEHLRRTRS